MCSAFSLIQYISMLLVMNGEMVIIVYGNSYRQVENSFEVIHEA